MSAFAPRLCADPPPEGAPPPEGVPFYDPALLPTAEQLLEAHEQLDEHLVHERRRNAWRRAGPARRGRWLEGLTLRAIEALGCLCLWFVLAVGLVGCGLKDSAPPRRPLEVLIMTSYTHSRPAQRPGQAGNAPARLAPAPGRMTLGNVTRGRQAKPFRVLVYGVEGVGKTTFGAGAPSPIFLCGEDGTSHLDVARFPAPLTWADVLEAVRVLTHDEHEYKTLVVDTLDWLEPLVWGHVCAAAGKVSIEDFGYGKGFVMALEHWRTLFARLDALVKRRGMHVVLVAHAAIKRVDDPYTGAFDRYRMKLHERAGDLAREWVDAVLFARHEVHTVEKNGKKRGVSSGYRELKTRWTAAYDAKNRFSLPEALPLDWDEFAAAARAGVPTPADDLRAELAELLPRLPDRAKAEKAMNEWAGDNPQRLAQLLDKVRARLGQLEGAGGDEGAGDQGGEPEGEGGAPADEDDPDQVEEVDEPPPSAKPAPVKLAAVPPAEAAAQAGPRTPRDELELRCKQMGLPAQVIKEHVAGLKSGSLSLEQAIKSCESIYDFNNFAKIIKTVSRAPDLEKLRREVGASKSLTGPQKTDLLTRIANKLGPANEREAIEDEGDDRPEGTGFDGQIGGRDVES